MANATAWAEGSAIGREAAQHSRDRKEMLSDEDRQGQADDLIKTKLQTMANLPSIKGLYGEGSPQWNSALQTIAQSKYDLHQLYHPINNPGALQTDWHFLLEKLHGIKQPKGINKPSSTSPAKGQSSPVAAGSTQEDASSQQAPPATPPEAATGATLSDPSAQAAWQAQAANPVWPSGAPIKGASPRLLRVSQPVASNPVPVTSNATPAAPIVPLGIPAPITTPPLAAAPPAPLTWKTRGQWQSPKEIKQKLEAMQQAQKQAALEASSIGLTPEEQANSDSSVSLAKIQGAVKVFKEINPTATPEEVSSYASTFLPGNNQIGNWERADGTLDGNSYPLSYDKKRAVYKLPDGSLSSTPPENWKSSPKATGIAAEKLKSYEENKRPNETFEEYEKRVGTAAGIKFDPNSGQIVDSQTGQRYSRNDPNLPPEVARTFASQQETSAEKQQKAIALVYARGQSMGASRFVMVAHPDGTVTYMPAGEASKEGAQSPAGIAFKTDAAMQRNLLGGGKIGQSILAYRTAAAHLDLLQQAADALNNGDVQFPNRTANLFNTAIGAPAPTNFDAIRAAVTGEIAKTFSTSVTLDDKAAILETINNAQSPAQIYGAISTYRALMLSKANNAELMGTAASQALADSFKGGTNTPPNTGGGNSAGKFAVTLPNGRIKHFPTQQAADQFKKAAGIK